VGLGKRLCGGAERLGPEVRKRFCGTAGVPPARVRWAQLSEVDVNITRAGETSAVAEERLRGFILAADFFDFPAPLLRYTP